MRDTSKPNFLPLTLFMALVVPVAGCSASSLSGKSTGSMDKDATTAIPADLSVRLAALKTKTRKNLVIVEGGTFKMGDFGPIHNADKLPYSGERDDDVLRDVTLDSYSVGAYKITYADYDVYTDATNQPKIAQDELDLKYRNLPDIPAGVNWYDAQAYCQWIGKQIGQPMDLPTEAQWEYAARSRGKMVVYPTDDGTIDDGRNVSSSEQYRDFEKKYLTRSYFSSIGLYPPNPLGIYDMIDHGYEWVLDWYKPEYNAKDTKNPQGQKLGIEKVQRANSDLGGDQLYITSMTFKRNHKNPKPPHLKRADGSDISSNQNSGNTFRCASR